MVKAGKNISLSVVTPALNEEENLPEAIESMVLALKDAGIDWEIVIVNDGSTDRTPSIAENLAKKYPDIKVLHHKLPMGIGSSFRDGALSSTKDAVTYLPGDGENEPGEVIKYVSLLEHVDIVNPFVVNKEVRSRFRRFLSGLYLSIINNSFGTNFHYTNGNVIYKRKIFDKVNSLSNSFFFQTEYLLRATKLGFSFAEVPIRIRGRLKGQSKALSLKSLLVLSKDYLRLLLDVNFLSKKE